MPHYASTVTSPLFPCPPLQTAGYEKAGYTETAATTVSTKEALAGTHAVGAGVHGPEVVGAPTTPTYTAAPAPGATQVGGGVWACVAAVCEGWEPLVFTVMLGGGGRECGRVAVVRVAVAAAAPLPALNTRLLAGR